MAFQALADDIEVLKKRVGAAEKRASDLEAVKVSGTTAERNTYFGTPSTTAEKVALANKRVVWFNTELGWEESYYAVTGSSGLTARGLITGTADGWYPTSTGPYIRLVANGGQAVAGGNQTITTWAAPGAGESRRTGGTAWFTYSAGYITTVKPGMYDVYFKTQSQAGAGTAWIYVASSSLGNLGIALIQFTASAFQNPMIRAQNIHQTAGATIRALSDIGSYTLNQSGNGSNAMSGEFEVRYVGPPLVSA